MQTVTTEMMTARLEARLPGVAADRAQSFSPVPVVEELDGPAMRGVFRFHTQPEMKNPMGVLHGGMTATILDSSMGALCLGLTGGFTPTISMTVNYSRPIPLNADILVRAQAAGLGRTTAHITASIVLADAPDRVCATATGVYYTAGGAQPTGQK